MGPTRYPAAREDDIVAQPRTAEAGSRDQILRALAPAPATVEQLAQALAVTPNAIRHQLVRLERDGLVGRRGTVKGTRRPSQLYGLTGEGVDALSRAYLPALLELLSVLEEKLPPTTLRRLMSEAGTRLSAGEPATGSLRERAEAGRALLEDLGGIVSARHTRRESRLDGAACPLGAAALRSGTTCDAVKSLLRSATGLEAEVACDLHAQPRPRCRFTLTE
jgi:predicted ArsR family transcriptional regulator